MSDFHRLVFELPASAEPRLVGELWGAGTLGLEVGELADGTRRIVAYFAASVAAAQGAARIERRCPEVELREFAPEPDRDWLGEYRRHARPRRLGRGLLVDPGEPDSGRQVEVPPGRRLLRLPARRAFGTGEHPSTRLVVEWLDDLELAGRSVLDVGCGSGILSFAAMLGGAGAVMAIEIDPVAALIAGQFQRLNRLTFGLVAGRAACLQSRRAFDLLLVNVLPQAVRSDLDDLRRLLAASGRAVFSGLVDEVVDEVAAHLRAHGFAPFARRRRDGWSALLTRAAARVGGPAEVAPC